MEITESMVYWITRLNGLKLCLELIGILLIANSIIWLIIAIYSHADAHGLRDEEKLTKLYKKHIIISTCLLVISIIMLISTVFIPDTKEMCAIKVLPLIAQNDNVKQLPDKVVNLANEWIDELSPKKNNSDN